MKKKMLTYQFKFEVVRSPEGLVDFTPNQRDKLKELTLGRDPLPTIKRYSKRREFVWADTVIGVSDIYPVLDIKIELESFTKELSTYTLEVTSSPEKLSTEDRTEILTILTSHLENDNFLFWWDSGDGALPKKPRKNKSKVFKEFKEFATYQNEDDLDASDAEVTVAEALKFFNFEDDAEPEEVASKLKDRLREKKKALHPDNNQGQEDPYIQLQKCQEVIEDWLESDLE